VEWTEEKHQHGSGNRKDLERFCMEEWSLISLGLISGVLQTHYMRRLRAVIWAKGGCKTYL